MKLKIVVDGTPYEVEVEEADEPGRHDPSAAGLSVVQSSVLPAARVASNFDEAKVVRSPLAGVVARLQSSPGQQIQANELLMVLEAMKMEIKINAQAAATIKSIEVKPGDAVRPNQILVLFE